MKTGKIIPVELIEIRKEDGAQCYKDKDGDHHWLSGWVKATNVKVGDKGILEYRSSTSHGLHFFIKEKPASYKFIWVVVYWNGSFDLYTSKRKACVSNNYFKQYKATKVRDTFYYYKDVKAYNKTGDYVCYLEKVKVNI